MFVWLASYPKSGNTLVRSMLAAYFFSKDGVYNFDLLKNIKQFPNITLFENLGIDIRNEKEVIKNYIKVQESFNKKKSIQFCKTHSYLFNFYNKYPFTNLDNTLGVIYIVRDPRNVITSLTHHYDLTYEEAYSHMVDENSSLLETSHELDHSNFTFLNSWSNHYKSWKNNKKFKTLFIKYEDLEKDKENVFEKVVTFINNLNGKDTNLNEKKFLNSIKSTNFSNLKNKELNEGFDEKVSSKKTGKVINFFNLGFNNRWQKLLPSDIKEKISKEFEKELKELNYFYE